MADGTTQAPFQAAVRNHRKRVIVELRGELDLATAHVLADVLQEARGLDGRALAVDMKDLSFMDCAGLHVLVSEHQRLTNDGGSLVVTNASPFVRRVLALAGYDHLSGPEERAGA
jgi:anti-sigma B factor antagonist